MSRTLRAAACALGLVGVVACGGPRPAITIPPDRVWVNARVVLSEDMSDDPPRRLRTAAPVRTVMGSRETFRAAGFPAR
jgi:hypothetical protein